MSRHEANKTAYGAGDVVSRYAGMHGLQPAESVLFDRHLERPGAMLDIGIGGGRTTAVFLETAERYVGIDASPEMIEASRRRFPNADLRVMDAVSLDFESASFDTALFSFNGIDCIHPRDSRERHVDEVRRVLRPGGLFIFSTHHPIMIAELSRTAPPFRLNRTRVKRLGRNLLRAATRLPTLLRGEGYYFDPADGGLVMYAARPKNVVASTTARGFELVELLRHDAGPANGLHEIRSQWVYYVFRSKR